MIEVVQTYILHPIRNVMVDLCDVKRDSAMFLDYGGKTKLVQRKVHIISRRGK